MKIEFDPEKRKRTLRMRGLDLAEASRIFDDFRLTHEDLRADYGEDRFVTLGVLDGEVVVCVSTHAAKCAAS